MHMRSLKPYDKLVIDCIDNLTTNYNLLQPYDKLVINCIDNPTTNYNLSATFHNHSTSIFVLQGCKTMWQACRHA